MTLKDIEEMTRERIGTKEIAALYGMSPGDVLRKAHSDDPEQRWPFNFTWNGNRLMVPREAFLAWARGVRGNEMDKPNPFCLRLPRGLRGWTSLIYKVVLIAAMLPVLDGLQAIGRGNSDMLPGLATLAFGLVLVLAGIGGYISVREEDFN